MKSNLPLEVLGWMSPVLCWVEGAEGLRYPQSWVGDEISAEEREQAWLIRELPTYSFDNVDEIIRLTQRRPERTDDSRDDHRSSFVSRDRGSRQPPSLDQEGAARGSRLRFRTRSIPPMLSPRAGYDLSTAFLHLGQRYFSWDGNELGVREGLMEELHELALRFPVAHLIRRMHAEAALSGYLSEPRVLDLPEQLSLLHTNSHGLRTVVHRGVSEGHLHLWGVTSSEEVWANHLLHPLRPGALASFRSQDERLLVLSRTAVRLLAFGILLAHLGCKDGYRFDLFSRIDQIYMARDFAVDWQARQDLRKELREAVLDACGWERLSGIRQDTDWLLRLIDPVARRLYWRLTREELGRRGQPEPEGIRKRVRLLERLHFEAQRLLAQLPVWSQEGGLNLPRQFLHEAFFRYVVFQTHNWQLSTQSGKTTGLRQFRRFFKAVQRRALSISGAEEQGLIFERLSAAECLRSVEGRISPPRSPGEMVPWVLGYAKGLGEGRLDRFGLVIHFIKADRGQNDSRASWTRKGNRLVRYGRIRRKTRETAFRLFRLLSKPHPAVPFIVGIDAANLELPTPPEVFSPAFRFLREFPIEVRKVAPQLERFGVFSEVASLVENRRLRMTYHVGEEFRHLLSGLRAIAEAIEFLDARPGDRLGHAIALALKPEVWAEQTGYQAVLPRQEWLDTLVWVHHFLGPGYDLLGELGIEDLIQQLSRAVYGRAGGREDREYDWPLPSLYDAWLLRQLDPYSTDIKKLIEGEYRIRSRTRQGLHHQRWADVQSRVLESVNARVGSNAAYSLLKLYWYHDEVRKNGDHIVTVDMQAQKDAWLRLCRAVQEKMKRLVQSREIVVEVNPSSNRLIGPLSEMSEHHIFDMTLDEALRLSRNLRVTINTDDPGVFNTSLAHEYYLLGEILMRRRGVPEAEVIEWLDWLRQNGNDSSFVNTLPPPGDSRIQKILASLKKDSRALQERLNGSRQTEAFWARLQERRQVYEDKRERDLRLSLAPRDLP